MIANQTFFNSCHMQKDQYFHYHRPTSKSGDITILEVHHSNYARLEKMDTALLHFILEF